MSACQNLVQGPGCRRTILLLLLIPQCPLRALTPRHPPCAGVVLPAVREHGLVDEWPDVVQQQPMGDVGADRVESDRGGEERAGVEEEVEVL